MVSPAVRLGPRDPAIAAAVAEGKVGHASALTTAVPRRAWGRVPSRRRPDLLHHRKPGQTNPGSFDFRLHRDPAVREAANRFSPALTHP